jgi:hypothetical protein
VPAVPGVEEYSVGVTSMSVDSTRVVCPLFQTGEGGSIPTSTLQAKDLLFELCPVKQATQLNREWHSRLPKIHDIFWHYAFRASYHDVIFAVALWSQPTTRCLPQHWLELRRMACAPDAPKNTASRFLGWMVRYFKRVTPERERCISYQDTAVHQGTIYRAAGWVPAYTGKAMVRTDRVMAMKKTENTLYRKRINGEAVDQSAKIRWEKSL